MGRSNLTFFIIAGLLLIVTRQFSNSPVASSVAVLVNVVFFEYLRQHYIINGASQGGALMALYVLGGWFMGMLLLSLLATALNVPFLSSIAGISLLFCLAVVLNTLAYFVASLRFAE